jgi:hypothetical protein
MLVGYSNTAIEYQFGADIDCYQLFAFLKSRCSNCYYFDSLALPWYQDCYFTLDFNPIFVMALCDNVLKLFGVAAKSHWSEKQRFCLRYCG